MDSIDLTSHSSDKNGHVGTTTCIDLWSDEETEDPYWDTPLKELIEQKRAFKEKARSEQISWPQGPKVRPETPQERYDIDNTDEALSGDPLVLWDPLSEGYTYDMLGSTSGERFDYFIDACIAGMINRPRRGECHNKTLYVSDQICGSSEETQDYLKAIKLSIRCLSCGQTPTELVVVGTSSVQYD